MSLRPDPLYVGMCVCMCVCVCVCVCVCARACVVWYIRIYSISIVPHLLGGLRFALSRPVWTE